MAAPDPREMYSEIGALLGAIAQAFSITEAEVITGVEQNRLTMEFGRDANGNPFVTATLDGRAARIYQGAIKREAPPGEAP
ncbi:MAG: hypothetical protein ACYCZX_10010 [Rhodospirillaceae bacterium]